ncbi:PEPxxWA-CTERM sorting domain-containing protein [Sphingomonas sp. KR1UV-12]|uniref:PEPxxWA-CTERM sorting domain-containing protein n=1 Tax=Sphingomonas aurea TaxID=3063994 RepID=A0ABT9EKE8_9SPHN|nr:PEPxxWA-CTERM sorting domain-containing protein [Sphingomonas sp. KR1UV-12]MDP1027307.1 PEPxxWA-CTERM sorting domain-containing protein [Sphingomonas sp. KR1UV-12]
MTRIFAITAAAAAIAAAAPAYATSFTVNTMNGGTTTSSNTYGNVLTYQAKTGAETLDVRATGWNVADGKVSAAKLVSYGAAGLGVTSTTDSGNYNTHTVDNLGGNDFILLQFSQTVNLVSATLNSYAVGSSYFDYFFSDADNDSTVKWGALNGAWNQALSLNGISEASLGKMFAGTLNVSSNGNAAQTYTIKGAGNLWMIGASQANPDWNTDGFKLAALTVNSVAAVPEPATWAMMLVGFGMVAATARYRRRDTKAAIA